MLNRFHRILERNGLTKRIAISISRICVPMHDKNCVFCCNTSTAQSAIRRRNRSNYWSFSRALSFVKPMNSHNSWNKILIKILLDEVVSSSLRWMHCMTYMSQTANSSMTTLSRHAHSAPHWSSSSRTCVMNHNWSATKQHLHPQSVAEISRHSGLSGDRIRHRHFLLQAPQCPCSMRKRFSRHHCCRGRSKPGCWIVGSHNRRELTTGADFQLCLHRLLMSTGCKSSHNGFLDGTTASAL